MTLLELINQMLPEGPDAFSGTRKDIDPNLLVDFIACPSWPVDLFAVVGTIIERSGCYTKASPDRNQLELHGARLDEIGNCARVWNSHFQEPPGPVLSLWADIVTKFADVSITQVSECLPLVNKLLVLFAIADEASAGIGWDVEPTEAGEHIFASMAFAGLTADDAELTLPNKGKSLCVAVPPDQAIVLPKSITSSVGCTIRSLSHHLALLPPISVLEPTWILSTKKSKDGISTSDQIRLLLIPFPFKIHASSFELSYPRTDFGERKMSAYFALEQHWLKIGNSALTAEQLVTDFILPLIEAAKTETGEIPNGVVLPECALTSKLAGEVASELAKTGIEFLITGVLDKLGTRVVNRALTFVFQEAGVVVMGEQNKHHRWRLDRGQTERYGLDFDASENSQWWEDIDVSQRQLPFFAIRKDMSLVTLICEDLARTDPAMPAIRAVGPNLVVALLMDGPQLAVRWPGRYATVLADDPGSAVLSFTCAAMVDRSNWLEAKPARSIGLWRDGTGRTQEIGLPAGHQGVVLTLHSKPKHQTTLDNRSDGSLSRQLTLRTVVPLFLAAPPEWL